MVQNEKINVHVEPGQMVRIFYNIHEGGKTRSQPYEGLVIALKGSGPSRTFTVRHHGVDGVGVERIFPLNSPNIERIEVLSKGSIRRAKLYFTRRLTARSSRQIEK